MLRTGHTNKAKKKNRRYFSSKTNYTSVLSDLYLCSLKGEILICDLFYLFIFYYDVVRASSEVLVFGEIKGASEYYGLYL